MAPSQRPKQNSITTIDLLISTIYVERFCWALTVIPSLYESNNDYDSQYNIRGNVITNDILVITKDKLWRIQVYENSNIGGLPIACIVTDGLVRYDFTLPFIKN